MAIRQLCQVILLGLAWLGFAAPSLATSLRFFGNGVDDIDRVKIRIDQPRDSNPGPPADIGESDFTIEFWMKALATDNPAPAYQCGSTYNWIFGNIIIDRDRFQQPRAFGISLGNGRVGFGVVSDSGVATICGNTSVLDGQWHHVAVQRRRADGWLWLYVDGSLQSEVNGPDGDISYPDIGEPLELCGPGRDQACINSDPFLVIGAEKHDVDRDDFPSYSGWIDELRLSRVIRYTTSTFPRPTAPFDSNLADTAALYHFDEGTGDVVVDSTPGNQSPGVRNFGGSPAGPEWHADEPFGVGSPGAVQLSAASYSFGEATQATITVRRVGGSAGSASVVVSLTDGTAMANADYQPLQPVTLDWTDGDSSNRTVAITLVNDSAVEGNESFNVTLSTAMGASLGTPASAVINIVDDDAAPPPPPPPPPAPSGGGGGGGLGWLMLAGLALTLSPRVRRRASVTKR
jgi:hypothetical protein